MSTLAIFVGSLADGQAVSKDVLVQFMDGVHKQEPALLTSVPSVRNTKVQLLSKLEQLFTTSPLYIEIFIHKHGSLTTLSSTTITPTKEKISNTNKKFNKRKKKTPFTEIMDHPLTGASMHFI